MNILIQFDDQNHLLATCIGNALTAYGDIGQNVSQFAAPDTPETEQPKPEDDTPVKTGTYEGAQVADLEPAGSKAAVSAVLAETSDKTVVAVMASDPVDEHGTAHNPDFCTGVDSNTTFYASGKRKGQWIRKRGGDTAAYDTWYASARPAPEAQPEPGPIDTAKAFTAKVESAAAVPADCPADPGKFMLWVSEQTAAGIITNEQVTAAYGKLGITVADMFQLDAVTVQGHVEKLFAELS